MPPASLAASFAAVAAALALAEERGAVDLAHAAAEAGVTPARLRELLEPVLFLEYRDAHGEVVTESGAFLLDDDVLRVDAGHWLRDLRATPPPPETALLLFLAGQAFRAATGTESRDLDRALDALAGPVASAITVDLDRPPQLSIVRDAWAQGRSLRCRYVRDDGNVSERELLPLQVFARSGYWYCAARAAAEPEAEAEAEGEPKPFRVDRMLDVRLGEVRFDPPDDVVVPDRFDLSVHDVSVRIRLPRERFESLPTPHRAADVAELPDDRVEATITVAGERRMEHLLLVAGAQATVLDAVWARRRRDHATYLLAGYEASDASP